MKKILLLLLTSFIVISCSTTNDDEIDISSWNVIAINGEQRKISDFKLDRKNLTSDWRYGNMQFVVHTFDWDDVEENLGELTFNEFRLIFTVYPSKTPPFEEEVNFTTFTNGDPLGKGMFDLNIEDIKNDRIFSGNAIDGEDFEVKYEAGYYYISFKGMTFREKNNDNTWGAETLTLSAKLKIVKN